MNNTEKIQLLGYRLRALDREADTLTLLASMTRFDRTFSGRDKAFAEIRRRINAARRACTEEIIARSGPNRKNAVSELRKGRSSPQQATHPRDYVTLQRRVLRDLRRIAQTRSGQDLLRNLDAAATRFKRLHWLNANDVLRIRCDSEDRTSVIVGLVTLPTAPDSNQRSGKPYPRHVTLYGTLKRALCVMSGKTVSEKALSEAQNEYAMESVAAV